jgi:hypothetical protein
LDRNPRSTDQRQQEQNAMRPVTEPLATYLLNIRLTRAAIGEGADAIVETDADQAIQRKLLELIAQRHGRVLDSTAGDLVFALDGAASALDASRAIHRMATQEIGSRSMTLRIGLLHAATHATAGRTWDAAIESVRLLARRAVSGQTLACMSPEDKERTSAFADVSSIQPEDWHEDLYLNQSRVFQVLWQDEVPTRLMQKAGAAALVTRVQQLRLRWRNKQLVLDPSSGPVVMGRGGETDIAIESEYASRRHAELRYVHSCFVLADQSTNGTYVQIEDSEFFLHEDELILRGEGWISLGRRAASAKGKVVYFSSEYQSAGRQEQYENRT